MKVILDESLCQGHAQCEYVAPEIFRMRDDGLAEVVCEHPDDAQRKKAEEAMWRCPADAIRIADE